MNTKLLFQQAPSDVATPLLAVFAVDTSTAIAKGKDTAPALLATSSAFPAAAPWLTSGEFKAALGETLLLHAPSGTKAERLLLIGLGKAKSLTPNEVRKGAGVAARFARSRGIKELAIAFPVDRDLAAPLPSELTARAIAEGVVLADFDIDFYRTDRKDLSLSSLTLVHREISNAAANEMQKGFDEGVIIAESQNLARTLINEPGNILTPTELGKRVSTMCKDLGLDSGLTCEVHSIDKILELKMGAFAAVTQGSTEPPALIILRYEPVTSHHEPVDSRHKPVDTKAPHTDSATPQPTAPNGEGAPLIGLVGKGITFDTGGISIKPAADMDKMKYDMAGAAAMIGAMRSIALLQPNVRVLAVICSCENMPDGKAFKPGDVVTAMSGKTIEIMNTDAEGRLVLADGLHYAQTLGATHLLAAATLTGAIGTALGHVYAGLFSNHDETAQRLLDTLPTSGEKFWRLPCTDDYRDQIKSQIADIMNATGSRYAGATTAAMFLKEFVGDSPSTSGHPIPIPWIHLDIAATTWIDDAKPWQSKGPSGIAVRSITEWVRSYAQ